MKTLAKMSEKYNLFLTKIEKYLPLLSLIFFVLGIWLARKSSYFAEGVDKAINFFIDSYGYFAPAAIYLILTPALIKILTGCGHKGNKFVANIILWFAKTRLMACIWGVIFTTVIFGLPLFINGTVTFGGAVAKSIKSLGWMLTHSIYFYTIYTSLLTVFISLRVAKVAALFNRCSNIIEFSGKHFIPVIPFFMLSVGSYVSYLPIKIKQQIGAGVNTAQFNTLEILGFSIHTNTPFGMVAAYLLGAVLTGVACFIWHFGLILVAKFKVRSFSIRSYFRDYWSKVYPLLWSTSSESLATPLNLHLVRKYYPQISPEIRGFTIGGGSFLGINGTIICVFVLAGLVAGLLGIKISFLQLFLSIPLVFLIGYGVPGIPGELLLFGGPVVIILGVPPSIAPIFLALYVGLQVGLPDSFRTGANSTDNCVSSVVIQQTYDQRFKKPIEIKDSIPSLATFKRPESIPIPVNVFATIMFDTVRFPIKAKDSSMFINDLPAKIVKSPEEIVVELNEIQIDDSNNIKTNAVTDLFREQI